MYPAESVNNYFLIASHHTGCVYMTILFCRAYYKFLTHGKYSWLVDRCMAHGWKSIYVMCHEVGGAATVLFLQRFIPNLYWNFKLGIFRFTACAGTFYFCSERFVYKKQTSSIEPWVAKRDLSLTLEYCLLQQYIPTYKNGAKVCIRYSFHPGIPWRVCKSSTLQQIFSKDNPPSTLDSGVLRNAIAASTTASIEAAGAWSACINPRWNGRSGERHTQRHNSKCGAQHCKFLHCQVATVLHSHAIFPYAGSRF